MGSEEVYLPSEFTILDGVPDHIRKGEGMRAALMETKLSPKQRMERIQDMFNDLKSRKSFESWGI